MSNEGDEHAAGVLVVLELGLGCAELGEGDENTTGVLGDGDACVLGLMAG